MTDPIRIAVIGTGGMGQMHLGFFDTLPEFQLVAVCDTNSQTLSEVSQKWGVAGFDDHRALLAQSACDAVLVATPHYDHPPIVIDALQAGKHVLCEKPLAVSTGRARQAIQIAQTHPELVTAVMFQMRARGLYRQARKVIASGELGELTRVVWFNTNWYRTQAYFEADSWRATWSGEGGGVLLNQCPHALDLLAWLVGLPNRLQAWCGFGKFHEIEVEDDVTAYLEFPNRATGLFVASTSESPGVDRQEIIGTGGMLVIENNQLVLHRNQSPSDQFIHSDPSRFSRPEVWRTEIPPLPGQGLHSEVLQNFAQSIQGRAKPYAELADGLPSLQLSCAMILSTLTEKWVTLPVDDAEYEQQLERLCSESTFQKKVRSSAKQDMLDSFH